MTHSARRTPPRSARPENNPESERARQAAVDILTSEGWESVTPSNVADRAGLDREAVDGMWADRNALVHDAVRTVALKAAVELLTTEGWDSVTQAKVAEASGLGRATVYRYWPKREDLVHEAVVAHMAIRTHIEPTGNLKADLRHELDHLATEMCGRKLNIVLAAIVDRAEFQPGLRDLKLKVHSTGSAVVRQLLQDGVRRKELRPDTDVEAGVSMLVGPITYRALVSEEPIDIGFVAPMLEAYLQAHQAPR